MELQQLLQVKLGLFQDLHLVHTHVLQGEHALSTFLNLLADRVRDQLGNKLLQITTADFASHNVKHLFADGADLRGLSVASLSDLLRAALGKADAEGTDEVSVRGLDVHMSLNERLPFLDHGAKLVRGKGHSVKVGETRLSLDFIDTETELAEGLVFALDVQVTKRHFQDTSTQTILRALQTLSTVDKSLSDVANGKHGRSLDVIPILAGEGVDTR